MKPLNQGRIQGGAQGPNFSRGGPGGGPAPPGQFRGGPAPPRNFKNLKKRFHFELFSWGEIVTLHFEFCMNQYCSCEL